mgnify:FL=1
MARVAKKRVLSSARSPRRIHVGRSFDIKEKRTEQHHAKSCDVNTIMARYLKTGVIDHVTRHKGTYGDVSGADYLTAQNLVAEQKTIFEELPAFARDHYENDVANYLEALQTDEGLEELRSVLHPTDTFDEKEKFAREQIEAAEAESKAEAEAETA